MNGAGVRNAIFDSVFFGSQQLALEKGRGTLSPGAAYGLAAGLAVTIDYVIDVAVKRSMSMGPTQDVVGVWRGAWNLLTREGLKASYRGLSVKSAEFIVSYFITGTCSVYVYRLVNG